MSCLGTSHPFYSSQISCSFASPKSLPTTTIDGFFWSGAWKHSWGFHGPSSRDSVHRGVQVFWGGTKPESRQKGRRKVPFFPSLSPCPYPQWLLTVLSLDLAPGFPLIMGMELILQSSNSIHTFYQPRQRAKLDPVLAGRQRTRKGSFFWKNGPWDKGMSKCMVHPKNWVG